MRPFIVVLTICTILNAESLPDTSLIPPEVLQSLGVDVFFSLWFVFEEDPERRLQSSPFTILAPINYSRTSPESLVNEEEIAREIITNHIIMGETIRPESLLSSKVRTSLGGKQLSFSIDSQGELWVNDVRILGWAIANEGIIFALEDYLYTKEPPFSNLLSKDESQELQHEEELSVPRDIQDSNEIFENVDWVQKEVCRNVSDAKVTLFKNIRLCVEEWVKVPKGYMEDSFLKLPKLLDGNFLNEFQKSLDDLEGIAYFKDYFVQLPNKSSIFRNDTFYTAFIPSDGAFRQFHPIDWGFNPFKVEAFVQEVILNAFIQGQISSSGTYKSLAGENYRIEVRNKSIYLIQSSSKASKRLSDFNTHQIYLVESLPFVNQVTIEEYKNEYGYLESGPLINDPFVRSPFLSTAWHTLLKMKQYSYMVEYLNKTLSFGDSAPFDPTQRQFVKEKGYTLFVPRDDAFWRLLIQDAGAPDPFLLDLNFRLNVLKGHLIPERLYLNSLHDNQVIQSVNNRSFTVQKDNETGIVTFNDGRQSHINVLNGNNQELWVYDLGNIIFIDKVLFVETSDIIKVMEDSLLKTTTTTPTTTVSTTTTKVTTTTTTTTTTVTTTTTTSPTTVTTTRVTTTSTSTTPISTTSPPINREEAPKFLKDILNPKAVPKIIYVNNKRVAILHEQDFDSLFSGSVQ